MEKHTIVVVGGGVAGLAGAALLAERGFRVQVYEKRPDPRLVPLSDRRSINFTLTPRGLSTLEMLGLRQQVENLAQPLASRVVHRKDGSELVQPYGKEGEGLWALRRDDLIGLLLERALATPGVEVVFGASCLGIDRETSTARFEIEGKAITVESEFIIGADGAFSVVRGSVLKGLPTDFKQTYFDWGYYELLMDRSQVQELGLSDDCLHVWPNQGSMLVGIPTRDGTLSLVFLLPYGDFFDGDENEKRAWAAQVLKSGYPVLASRAPAVIDSLLQAKFNWLVNTDVSRWHFRDKVVLIGDACHAVFPFYGQGMNAALGDVLSLVERIHPGQADRREAFMRYEESRKQDVRSLAQLSEKHFFELKNRAASMSYVLQLKFDTALSSALPGRWHHPYRLISHPGKGYDEAMKVLRAQARIKKVTGVSALIGAVAALAEAEKRIGRMMRSRVRPGANLKG